MSKITFDGDAFAAIYGTLQSSKFKAVVYEAEDVSITVDPTENEIHIHMADDEGELAVNKMIDLSALNKMSSVILMKDYDGDMNYTMVNIPEDIADILELLIDKTKKISVVKNGDTVEVKIDSAK